MTFHHFLTLSQRRRNFSARRQSLKGLCHRNAARLRPGEHRVFNLRQFALADHVADSRCWHHYLAGQHPAATLSRQQPLRQHRFERHRQRRSDQRLTAFGKNINDAVNRFHRRARMQGCKHQMPGFRCQNGRFHRLEIPHLSHQKDIGIPAAPIAAPPQNSRCRGRSPAD